MTKRYFEEITLPHLDAAYNLARWLVRNDHDAQDVVQESYLRAFKSFAGFHGGNARPWLLAITRNAAYSWLQQNRRRELEQAFDDEAHGALNVERYNNGESEYVADPATILARMDDWRLVNEALEKLPLQFREVLILRDVEELSYKEIAQISEVPIGTVMSRLARGRKLMLAFLAPQTIGG